MTSTLLKTAELIFKRNLSLHKSSHFTKFKIKKKKQTDSVPSLVRSIEKYTKGGKNI